ncbi:hypothetical protein [Rubinisphaera italica]|uniref:hypothetical protein n=1 Tax=Rubinisphaera italica TaxID=2527969 RepID=UPI0011B3DEE6|nr:hypothetical protein [Rubinisphaera italica]
MNAEENRKSEKHEVQATTVTIENTTEQAFVLIIMAVERPARANYTYWHFSGSGHFKKSIEPHVGDRALIIRNSPADGNGFASPSKILAISKFNPDKQTSDHLIISVKMEGDDLKITYRAEDSYQSPTKELWASRAQI